MEQGRVVETERMPNLVGVGSRAVVSKSKISNLFNFGGRLVRAKNYRDLRVSAFKEWVSTVA